MTDFCTCQPPEPDGAREPGCLKCEAGISGSNEAVPLIVASLHTLSGVRVRRRNVVSFADRARQIKRREKIQLEYEDAGIIAIGEQE